jgi:hypothetical protein
MTAQMQSAPAGEVLMEPPTNESGEYVGRMSDLRVICRQIGLEPFSYERFILTSRSDLQQVTL